MPKPSRDLDHWLKKRNIPWAALSCLEFPNPKLAAATITPFINNAL
jgi:hypothetical protein